MGVTALLLAMVLLAAARMARRRRSAVPLLLLAGGFTSVLMEAPDTLLGHTVHPAVGQIILLNAADRAIPWHIAPGYAAGFGLFNLSLYPAFLEGRLDEARIWQTCLVTPACHFVGEA